MEGCFILHGKGIGNWDEQSQSWLTNKYEDKRRKGLRDRTNLTSDEITYYEISGAQGLGSTNNESFEIKQFPFPTDSSIRKRKTIDIRKVDKKIGDSEDII